MEVEVRIQGTDLADAVRIYASRRIRFAEIDHDDCEVKVWSSAPNRHSKEKKIMFDNLDEQIEHTQGAAATQIDRLIRFAGIALLSMFLFGGLYLGIVVLE